MLRDENVSFEAEPRKSTANLLDVLPECTCTIFFER
jgi:hypothetical protein